RRVVIRAEAGVHLAAIRAVADMDPGLRRDDKLLVFFVSFVSRGQLSSDGRNAMGEILGVGCTHRPLMLRPNEDWTFMMRAALDDPAMPEAMKNPARWPAPLREELGNDWGAGAAARGREVYRAHFAEARRRIDKFKPDLVVMWGDDQYENFKEDIIPPFAVLAYEDQERQPWAHRRSTWNPWGEPADTTVTVKGHKEAGKYLATGLIDAGI